jgi:hypothetical protein
MTNYFSSMNRTFEYTNIVAVYNILLNVKILELYFNLTP